MGEGAFKDDIFAEIEIQQDNFKQRTTNADSRHATDNKKKAAETAREALAAKRGRPVGSTHIDPATGERRKPSLTKWKPAKGWQPEYERMVAYSVMGWSNKRIAMDMGYTPQHVSNVLNLDQAEVLRNKLLERLHEKAIDTIPTLLDHVAKQTSKRLKEMIDDDELFKKSPFAVIDRGLDVLKGLKHLQGGGNGANSVTLNQQFVMPVNQANILASGLSKANEVAAIHQDYDPSSKPK